jgi:hypothetical protein
MLEERFQQSDDRDTSLRGRYRLSFTIPINRYTVQPGALYMPVADRYLATFSGSGGACAGHNLYPVGARRWEHAMLPGQVRDPDPAQLAHEVA